MQSLEKEIEKDNNQQKDKKIQKNENIQNNSISTSLLNSNTFEQNKIFIDNYFEKMSKKEAYSVTMGAFICIKKNNYLPLTKDEIFDKLRIDYKHNPHKFIKYGKNN